MTLIPSFEAGLWNGWLFMIVFPLQWLAVVVVPKHVAERTSHAPEIIQNRLDRTMAFLTQGLWIGATIYSIFVPFQLRTPWLWAGLALFAAGAIILVLASVSVAGTPADKPFTSGVYRFSRHPMYLSMILVYLAVSVAAVSWLFLLITIITFFLQRHQAGKEERYCCGKYGDAYRDYMSRTPRWVGAPGRAVNG